MRGSKTTTRNRDEVLTALRSSPVAQDFVWDGADEDDRPASAEELETAVAAYRRRRGRPAGSATKEQVAIRFDREVLAAFRSSGPGWQTRMNAVLREWLKTHSPT